MGGSRTSGNGKFKPLAPLRAFTYNESHGKISSRNGRCFSQTKSISIIMQRPHTEASFLCFHWEQVLFSAK